MENETILIDAQALERFGRAVFDRMGCSPAAARQAADVLLRADLRGIDSHGFARLSGYVRLWKTGRINPQPKVSIEHQTPSTATLNAGGGLGLTAAVRAMDIAIEKARACGSGWVAVKNSNHFGIAGYHAMRALPEDMIGLAMTNASPLVAPTFSTERLLGTNPICIAIPAGEQPPFVADFATTTAANGKLEILQRRGREAPLGWIQTREGKPTTDPHALKDGGALLPLGSDYERASHKGFCLGAWVDIFSAVLSGANYGPWVPPFVSFLPLPANPVGEGIGHFLGAMRVDAFRPAADFKRHMDQWIMRFRNATPAEGRSGVVIPGDPERASETLRKEKGIPLNRLVAKDLVQLGEELDVAPPAFTEPLSTQS